MNNPIADELRAKGFQPLHRDGTLGYIGRTSKGLCVILKPDDSGDCRVFRIRNRSRVIFDSSLSNDYDLVVRTPEQVDRVFSGYNDDRRWAGVANETKEILYAIALHPKNTSVEELEEKAWENIHEYREPLLSKLEWEFDLATAARVAGQSIGYIFGILKQNLEDTANPKP